jgi:hypothetical protein
MGPPPPRAQAGFVTNVDEVHNEEAGGRCPRIARPRAPDPSYRSTDSTRVMLKG